MQMSNVEEKDMDRKYWSRSEKKQWSAALFLGCAALYACRTVMPLSIVSISKELGWDKTESASVLSSFFWGYTMTQFLGGYLSDKIGGDVVVPIAACFWSVITFWTPQITYISDDKQLTLRIVIFSRVLLGMFQGNLAGGDSICCWVWNQRRIITPTPRKSSRSCVKSPHLKKLLASLEEWPV